MIDDLVITRMKHRAEVALGKEPAHYLSESEITQDEILNILKDYEDMKKLKAPTDSELIEMGKAAQERHKEAREASLHNERLQNSIPFTLGAKIITGKIYRGDNNHATLFELDSFLQTLPSESLVQVDVRVIRL